ncbi:sugar transferase [Bacillus sp. UTDS19-33BHI26]|uniref:sugar transferase n=1 Tax=Bacillus sp. UTDS19-33BHI26 TaxID=2901441 RepID=UPI001EDAB928|nr:sugar transferase [Bacillus sp. UTDS19-33BHI26]MCG3790426.1 sugar transferase [Bacillus sp. UTDS19-33BHI26]
MNLVKISSEVIEGKELNRDEVNSNKIYLIVKRCMDFIGALCGIVLLSPVFLIVALLIKYEDPKGSVFFKQERVGKDGTRFNMYKFRSMVIDAEDKLNDLLQLNEASGAMFKMKEDPRVTKIGRFIRKTSIDELPQLINVLKGEMSLVGPRPPLPREVKEYTPYDMQRLMVTPGCTGLWQVSGRNDIGFEEMVYLDIFYIKNRKIMLDIKIIIATFAVFFSSKGEY